MATLTAARPRLRAHTAVYWIPLAVAVAMFAPTLLSMARDWWQQPDLSQGLILAPLSIWLFWRRAEAGQPEPRGIWLTAFGCSTFLLGKLAAELFTTRLAFVIVVAGLVLTFRGRTGLRRAALPLAFLAAAVPLPAVIYNALTARICTLCADAACAIAQTFGVSLFRDGNAVQLANASFEAAEACFPLACVPAWMLLLAAWRRYWWLPAALAIAVLISIGKLTMAVLIADRNPALALSLFHGIAGWVVFPVGCALPWRLRR